MEPISLSISAIALATLFHTCLECFEYFQNAKSLPNDLELLLLKLDCQKERLLTWGEIVGISKTTTEGRDPELDSPKSELVKRCLNSITSLFSRHGEASKGIRSRKHNCSYFCRELPRIYYFRQNESVAKILPMACSIPE